MSATRAKKIDDRLKDIFGIQLADPVVSEFARRVKKRLLQGYPVWIIIKNGHAFAFTETSIIEAALE